MALAVTVNFVIKDAKGKSSTTRVRVPTGFSLSQYIEFGQAMGQIIANMIDGTITEISIGVPLDISGATIKSVANDFADIAKKVFMQFVSTIGGLFGRQNIPTYDESHSVTGSDDVNQSDAAVSAYVALMEAGLTVGLETIHMVDRRGNDIDTLITAREIFRKQS